MRGYIVRVSSTSDFVTEMEVDDERARLWPPGASRLGLDLEGTTGVAAEPELITGDDVEPAEVDPRRSGVVGGFKFEAETTESLVAPPEALRFFSDAIR